MFTHDDRRTPGKVQGGQVHTPALHTVLAGHLLPHAPQLEALALPSTSQPLTDILSQSRKEPLHDLTVHMPPAQATTALGRLVQSTPQAPQFFASALVDTSQPSPTVTLQSAKPWLHEASAHLPSVQAGTPLGAMHARPQVPQL